MCDPDDRRVEAVVIVSEFHEKMKGLGLEYSSAVSVWEKGDSDVFTMFANSDAIAAQRTVSAAVLADGRGRLIETKESVYPPDADLHPENARIIHRKGSVSYTDDKIVGENYFSEILDIFKVDNS